MLGAASGRDAGSGRDTLPTTRHAGHGTHAAPNDIARAVGPLLETLAKLPDLQGRLAIRARRLLPGLIPVAVSSARVELCSWPGRRKTSIVFCSASRGSTSGWRPGAEAAPRRGCVKLPGQSIMARDFDRRVVQNRAAAPNRYTAFGMPAKGPRTSVPWGEGRSGVRALCATQPTVPWSTGRRALEARPACDPSSAPARCPLGAASPPARDASRLGRASVPL